MNWLAGFVAVVAIFGMPSLEAVPVADGCIPGQQFLPHPDYCTKFFHCANGMPVEKDCPAGTVFNYIYNVCVHTGSEFDICTPVHPDRECERNTALLIPHPTRCQGYYNCSDHVPDRRGGNPVWSNGYQKECPYPKLFDIRLKRCESYKYIVCGKGREEAKWECDYYAAQCPRAHCISCSVGNPSCVGKANGVWPIPDAIGSPYYIECEDERNLKGRQSCPAGETFDSDERKCRNLYDMMRPSDKGTNGDWGRGERRSQ